MKEVPFSLFCNTCTTQMLKIGTCFYSNAPNNVSLNKIIGPCFFLDCKFSVSLQAFLQYGSPDQCFHSCSAPPSAHPSRGEPLSRRPRPPRPVIFLLLHLLLFSRPPGLKYRRAAPQGQGTLGSAHPAEHLAGRSHREGGVLNTRHQL